jgi:hypothetical protein
MQLRGRTSSEVAPAGACLAPSVPDQPEREDASGAEPQSPSCAERLGHSIAVLLSDIPCRLQLGGGA